MKRECRELQGNKTFIDNNFILKIIIPPCLKVLLNFPEVFGSQISIENTMTSFETKSNKTPTRSQMYSSKQKTAQNQELRVGKTSKLTQTAAGSFPL